MGSARPKALPGPIPPSAQSLVVAAIFRSPRDVLLADIAPRWSLNATETLVAAHAMRGVLRMLVFLAVIGWREGVDSEQRAANVTQLVELLGGATLAGYAGLGFARVMDGEPARR